MTSSVTKGYVTTGFGQVHYRTCGERRPGQLPLVLLHQTASSSVMYERLMALLGDDYWMFAPDTPGFGGTAALAQRGSVAGYAQVIVDALRCMDIERCWLFGHHSGASIAVQIAFDHPEMVERLALSGPPYLTASQIEQLIPGVCPVSLDTDGGHVAAVWNRIRAKDPSAPLELSHRETVLNLHAGTRYPEAYNAVFEHALAEQLAAIECKTLVMAGARDTIAHSVAPAFRVLRDGEIKMFPTGGTYICDRAPHLVGGALTEFFTSPGATHD